MQTKLSSFLKLVTENKEVHNNELKQTIEKIYKELNSLLYNNSLPIIDIKVKKMKNVAASVLSMRNRLTGITKPTLLNISDYWELDYDTWRGIIAHELVHVYISHNNIRDIGGHGYKFMRELDRINTQHPEIKAPRFHEGMKHPLSKHYQDNIKSMDYMVYQTYDNKKWVMVGKGGSIERDRNNLIDFLIMYKNRILKVWIGYSSDENLEKLPKSRNFSSVKGYGVPQDMLDDLIENATYTFDTNKDLSFKSNKMNESYTDFMRLPKNNKIDTRDLTKIKNISWKDIQFEDFGSDSNIAKLGVVFPFKTNASDNITIDIQTIPLVEDKDIYLYQLHINISDNLQKIGLGYKLYKALINDLGHLYSGKGRRMNPIVTKIWNKLKNDSDFLCISNDNADLCMIKNNPNKKDYINFIKK